MMNEHIFFNVQELHPHTHKLDKFDKYKSDLGLDNQNNFDLDNLLIDMNNSPDDDIYHHYLDYMNNYNVKSLTQLMVKQDMLMMKLVIDIRCQQMIMQLVDFFEC